MTEEQTTYIEGQQMKENRSRVYSHSILSRGNTFLFLCLTVHPPYLDILVSRQSEQGENNTPSRFSPPLQFHGSKGQRVSVDLSHTGREERDEGRSRDQEKTKRGTCVPTLIESLKEEKGSERSSAGGLGASSSVFSFLKNPNLRGSKEREEGRDTTSH